jgi:acyl-coenzyme A thioesterase PaaI-like protein
MKKLKNPYAQYDGYNCFGCDPGNSFGLKMSFYEDGDEIVSRWSPEEQYQGYFRVLHGGIQATLMDELASWVVFVKCRTSGMTGSIQVAYQKSVSVDEGEIEVRGRLESQDRKKARIRCMLYQAGELKSEGYCEYMIFSEQLARRKLHYPGVEAFYGA